MKIITKHSKHEKKKFEVTGKLILVDPDLSNIYQNSEGVGHLIMEKSEYGIVGCRATANFKNLNHVLTKNKTIHDPIPFERLDSIADEGGMYKDCWKDGTKKNPVFDILHVGKLVEKINNIFQTELFYSRISKKDSKTKDELYSYIVSNIPMCIKMPNLISKKYKNHFVNVIGAIKDENGEVYFLMKETYKRHGYEGYDGYFVKWDVPEYYEVIL